ncbi:hypothetical protein WBQ88_16890 [Sphingopyxis sp. CCNWLW253]|uniref:hypothetical protein n=1 Tax=unclassified Sphingopyxis TaxID=2614943 RepID=UPI0030129D3F
MFFDMHIERRAKHAPFPSMNRIADLLVAAAADDNFPLKEFEKGEVTYIIKKAVKDESDHTLSILLESADKNAPNTRYVNHAAKTKRDFDKQKDEGGGHSAHIVISLTSEKSGDNVYVCLMEKAPSFPEHRVKSVLNAAIRVKCKEENHFLYTRPGGSKKEIAYVPHLEFKGHLSDALQSDLEAGVINSLTLIEPDTAKPLGQSKFFSGVEKQMKVKMVRKPGTGNVLSAIKAAAKSQSSDYSRIRISFKPEDGGQSTHVDLSTDTGQLVSDGYIKTRHFGGITPSIKTTAVDDFVAHLVSRMKSDLFKERS